jgi:hypothetical protein
MLPTAAPAQTPSALLDEGVSAYQDLEFGVAARILRRALEPGGEPPLTLAQRQQALMYLGATEVLRDRRNEGIEVFRTLTLLDPRYRPDRLVFPPRVTRTFDEVLRTTKVVAVESPREQTMVAGSERWQIRLWVSSSHHVTVAIRSAGGDLVRTLHDAPIADSLVISWDGIGANGAAPPAGRYRLEAVSMVTPGTPIRSVQVPIDWRAAPLRTLSAPAHPPDSLFLPEARSAGGSLKILLPSAVMGAALILPALDSDSDNRDVRIVVGGVVTLAGLVGFVLQRPSTAIPENVAHNDSLRTAWQEEAARVEQENQRRRGVSRFVIRAGEPQRTEGR